MSASKSKQERQTKYLSGQLDKNPAKTKQTASRKKIRTTVCIILACIVVLGALCGMLLTGFFRSHTTALTVGSHKLTGVMFGYYYQDAFLSFQNSGSGLMGQMVDSTKPLNRQPYGDNGKTWADYFVSQGTDAAKNTYALYDAAMAAGYTLSDEDTQILARVRDNLETLANASGSKSAADYLQGIYGRWATPDTYAEYVRINRIASSYAAHYKQSLSYSDEQIQKTYAANPDDFTSVSYKIFYVNGATGKNADGTVIADLDAARQKAEDMAKTCRGDVEQFNRLCVELAPSAKKASYSDPKFTLRENCTLSDANDALRDWLSDPARQYGDTTSAQADEQAYYVGFYLGRSDNNYALANIRQIFVAPLADAANTADPDGMGTAKARAQAILDEFTAGKDSEDAFAALAAVKSQDSASTASGGLYENYYPGQLDNAVSVWCFDAPRKAGDVAMLQGADGYHIVYFASYGPNYREYLVDQKLRTADYDSWYKSLTAAITATPHKLGLFFVKR